MTKRSILEKTADTLLSTLASLLEPTSSTLFYVTYPADLRSKLAKLDEHAAREACHCRTGTKLRLADA